MQLQDEAQFKLGQQLVEKSLFLPIFNITRCEQFHKLVFLVGKTQENGKIAWITPPSTRILHKWVLTPLGPFAHYPSKTQTIDLLESFSSNEKLYLFLCIKWAKGSFRYKLRRYHLGLSFDGKNFCIASHNIFCFASHNIWSSRKI